MGLVPRLSRVRTAIAATSMDAPHPGCDESVERSGGSWIIRRFVAALLLVAGVAFVARVVYVVVETHDRIASPDELYYRDAAVLLADGEGFESPAVFGTPGLHSAEHPPLTAVALAPAAGLTGDSELAMRLTVALAGAGVVVVVGLVGREVAGPRAGLIAAVVAAAYPNLFANDGLLMSETFATLGTAAAVLFTYRVLRSPTGSNAVGLGVSCAVAMLSRSELALLVPLLVVPVLMARDLRGARRVRLTGVALVAAAVPVAPWVSYNLVRFEEPVLLSHGDGGVLLGANCDETYSGPRLGSWYGFCAPGTSARVDEHSVDGVHKRDLAFDYIEDHLGRLPVVVAARVGRVWSAFRPFQDPVISHGEARPLWVSHVGWAMYWALMVLAGAGLWTLRRRGVPVLPFLAPVVVVTLVAALFYGNVRFRAPAEVSIVALAAVTLDALAGRHVERRPTRAGQPSRLGI
ncbi:MAG: ArnT family glycosyltransferase [Acidimicrobiia bacterium]